MPTIAGRRYLLSFWLANPAVGTPNEFQVAWNGATLFDQTSMGQFGWTNLQFVVTARGSSSALRFGARNDQNAFALDDISLQAVRSPILGSATIGSGGFHLQWAGFPGVAYQVQYSGDLGSATWTDLGRTTAANNGIATATDPTVTAPGRFYRVVLAP